MSKIVLPEQSKMLQPDFIFGVATSSFQIEGGRDLRQKNIWDTFCTGPNILDKSNGDIACDHFHRWEEDVEHIQALNVDAYRMSIAWPRVLHQDGSLNEAGLAFYEAVIDKVKALGKKVFVTLYHWDLPQHLEDQGGWLNRDTAHAFAAYADIVSQRLGDKVDAWTTLNEPFCAGHLSYEAGVHAPGLTGRKNGRQASHNLLLAHGLALPILRKNCPHAQHGIVLNIHPGYAASDSPADIEATELATQYLFTWYIDAVLKGEYPEVINHLAPEDRPEIQDGDMALISAPIDFMGMNYYTRNVYRSDGNGWYEHVAPAPEGLTEMGWEIVPEAFSKMLIDLDKEYDLPDLYITENGAAMPDQLVDGKIHDADRIAYFQSHLLAVDKALEAGVNIKGYFAWSLLDNFEWALGYSKRFGLIYVDYPTQRRIWKDSAYAFQSMLESRKTTMLG